MSNGVFEEVKEIIESGQIPQKVSNRLLAALVIEAYGQGKKNADDIKILQQSDKRWKGFTIAATALAAYLGLGTPK